MWPPFSCSWPPFDEQMECKKWSNLKNIAFFDFLTKKMYILICHKYIIQKKDSWWSWPHKFEIWPQKWSWLGLGSRQIFFRLRLLTLFKRLRLLVFFKRLRLQGAKNTRLRLPSPGLPGLDHNFCFQALKIVNILAVVMTSLMTTWSFFSKFRSGNRWCFNLRMDFCFKPHQNRFINDQNIEKAYVQP